MTLTQIRAALVSTIVMAAWAAMALIAPPAHAQTAARVVATCGTVSPSYVAAQFNYPTVDVNGNLCNNGSGGGGGGGPVTIADGADVSLGAKGDAAQIDPTQSASLIAFTKGMQTELVDIEAAVSAAIPAGTNIIGKVGIDQTTPGTTNGVQTLSGSTTVVTGSVAVTGTFWQATQPVSGTFWQATQPVSVASLPALPANQSVNVAQVGGTNTVNGGVAGSQAVGGNAANNASTSGNPVQASCLAESAEPTLATNGQNASCATDLAHKLIVAPYANKENFVSGTTAAMTGTTSTLLLAAPAGSLRNYVTQIACVNSHATVGTFITVQDGSGGTALATLAAASVFGGSNFTFPTPLKQPTVATGLYVADVTTGANVICTATGYTGT